MVKGQGALGTKT